VEKEVVFSHSGVQLNAKVGGRVVLKGHLGAVGETLEVGNVLAIKAQEGFRLGTPHIEGARVILGVLSHDKGPKVRVFKMKRRKRYRKTQGYRDYKTVVKVESIQE
jgi:large subunit ribosomal protein L21